MLAVLCLSSRCSAAGAGAYRGTKLTGAQCASLDDLEQVTGVVEWLEGQWDIRRCTCQLHCMEWNGHVVLQQLGEV